MIYPRTDSSIFTSIASVLSDQSNETISVFPSLKSGSHFPPQSAVSWRSYSSSKTNSNCSHRLDVWSVGSSAEISSASISVLQITLAGSLLMCSR